jgi:hypothetical protein
MEIQVILEIGGAIGCAMLLPPENIGVRLGTADAQFCGFAVERGGSLIFEHGVYGHRTGGARARADRVWSRNSSVPAGNKQ